MSGVMTEDWVDSKMKQMSVFFTLMIIIINKIFNSVVRSDEFYILKKIMAGFNESVNIHK